MSRVDGAVEPSGEDEKKSSHAPRLVRWVLQPCSTILPLSAKRSAEGLVLRRDAPSRQGIDDASVMKQLSGWRSAGPSVLGGRERHLSTSGLAKHDPLGSHSASGSRPLAPCGTPLSGAASGRPALSQGWLQPGRLPALPVTAPARTQGPSRWLTLHPQAQYGHSGAADKLSGLAPSRPAARHQGHDLAGRARLRPAPLALPRAGQTGLQSLATAAAINRDRLAEHPPAPRPSWPWAPKADFANSVGWLMNRTRGASPGAPSTKGDWLI